QRAGRPVSEFTVTVFRLAFFVILWLFVLGGAGVLRRDIFGPRRSRKSRRGGPRSAPAPASRPAPAPRPAAAPVAHAHPGTLAPTRVFSLISVPLSCTSPLPSLAPVFFGPPPDTTIAIDASFASRPHARISPQRGAWMLEDLGSMNGTLVDASPMIGPVQLCI